MAYKIDMNIVRETKAHMYAEKYGIVEYYIKRNEMFYYIDARLEQMKYKATVNLTTMYETRKKVKFIKRPFKPTFW
jgi:hypothetical protein